MGRLSRRNHPGIAFHLVTVTQGRERLLEGMQARIAMMLGEWTEKGGVQLLAYAVMSNHLHIIAVQGAQPLRAYMHPLLSDISLLVNRTRDREGHVFQRRYYDTPCFEPDYLRAAIAYAHLNPVRAGICSDPTMYEWTSNGYYCAKDEANVPAFIRAGVATGLRLFGIASTQRASCQKAHNAYLAWRIATDRLREAEPDARIPLPPAPVFPEGDRFWNSLLVQHVPAVPATSPGHVQPELATICADVLASLDPSPSLEDILDGFRKPAVTNARREIIRKALGAGYRNHEIARYLNTSSSTVTQIASEKRRSRPA
jgi:REP element-mobilizing transposase RayT